MASQPSRYSYLGEVEQEDRLHLGFGGQGVTLWKASSESVIIGGGELSVFEEK